MPEYEIKLKKIEDKINKLENRITALENKTERTFKHHSTWLKNIDSVLTKFKQLCSKF